MKIKGYKLFVESNQTEESVSDICERYRIKNWSLNSEGLVDVDGSVVLSFNDLIKLPLNFGKVRGYFHCSYNKLTTLEGCPKEVGGDFSCSYNELITLEGAPKEVGGDFSCCYNVLTSLKGAPEKVGGGFDCFGNQLTSLEGGPEKVGGLFSCFDNQLTSLIGGPHIVIGEYCAFNNKITTFEGFPEDYEGVVNFRNTPVQKILDQFPPNLWVRAIHLINDYDAIWRGEVIPERLEMVREKLGITNENN